MSEKFRQRAKQALRESFACSSPKIVLDAKGYVAGIEENLLPEVCVKDFEADIRQGAGQELSRKSRAKLLAVHSSTALAVNCFAPFRRHIADLSLLGHKFDQNGHIRFEGKCPTGLRGTPPHLDVLVQDADTVIGIESKLTEHLGTHRAKFSPSYCNIRDEWGKAWVREMQRLKKEPRYYVQLDAAQLIKHAFGLARTFPDKKVTLLYLYWEPVKSKSCPVIAEHRQEVADFAARVADSTPHFEALSYTDLWRNWSANAPPDWLVRHIEHLRARYAIAL